MRVRFPNFSLAKRKHRLVTADIERDAAVEAMPEHTATYRDSTHKTGQSGPSNKAAESGTAERSNEAEFIDLFRDLSEVDQVRA